MYLGQKELVRLAAEAIDMGYTKATLKPRPDRNDDGTYDRDPLHRVIRQVTGCKYYVYFRRDSPVASAYKVPVQHIIHTLGMSELSGDALKGCHIHGYWLTNDMMVKAERAIADDKKGDARRARLAVGDYAA